MHFLHINFLLEFFWCNRHHSSLSLLDSLRPFFIFLKNLAWMACSVTFTEFLCFNLISWTSNDARNYFRFISDTSLDSSISATMWSKLAIKALETFSTFCNSMIFLPHGFIWLVNNTNLRRNLQLPHCHSSGCSHIASSNIQISPSSISHHLHRTSWVSPMLS